MKKQDDLTRLLNTVASHIRTRRREMGITQEQLAERSELSPNYIARLELATNTPSMATLIKLSKALQMEVSDMLAGKAEPVSADNICTALILPLNDHEKDYALSQLRSTVNFILSLRKGGNRA